MNNTSNNQSLSFNGKGATYFGIIIVNMILIILTLGIYYPWAKIAYRKYLWSETHFKGQKFIFHGTGLEIFKGFIIAYCLLILFYVFIGIFNYYKYAYIFISIIYFLFIFIIPLAIFGAWRYRLTKTSWRGIFFRFDGNIKSFVILFFRQLFFTIITFGIYYPWMIVAIFKYLINHSSIGNLKFTFHGYGKKFLIINLMGIVLTYLTLFLYTPIWIKNIYNFYINNIRINDETIKTEGVDPTKYHLKSSLNNGTAWTTLVGNVFLIIFTAGLAFPWVVMRTMRMYLNNVIVPDLDFDNLTQSNSTNNDATGEGLVSAFDIDF